MRYKVAPQGGLEPPSNPYGLTQVNSLPAYQLAYRGMKMVVSEGLEPPLLYIWLRARAIRRYRNDTIMLVFMRN